jgi:hypothetical protein
MHYLLKMYLFELLKFKEFGVERLSRHHPPTSSVDAHHLSGLLQLQVLQLAGQDHRPHDRKLQPPHWNWKKISRSRQHLSGGNYWHFNGFRFF